MESYLRVVGQAVLVFPVAAALIALPFLIHHYRKYGGMTFARFFLSYSFVLYALCAYFLVILPLPDREAVAQMTGPSVQLLPFSFFRDLSKETGFQLAEPSTYLPALLSTFTLQFVFNIALLMPLGFYLRYYFRRKLLPAVLISLGVSLFFELTQLSGLYGYYPRAYRLFDVDDLLCNTLGGFLGYVLTGPLMKILPDRDKIDEKSYQKGERVTFTRRCLSLFVDMIFVSLLGTVLSIFLSQLPFNLPFALAYLLYFGLFQGLWGGKSLGKRLTKICVVNQDGSRVLLWRCLLRYGSAGGFFLRLLGRCRGAFHGLWLGAGLGFAGPVFGGRLVPGGDVRPPAGDGAQPLLPHRPGLPLRQAFRHPPCQHRAAPAPCPHTFILLRKEVPYGTFVRAAKIPLLRRGQHLRRPKDQGPRQRPAAALLGGARQGSRPAARLCLDRGPVLRAGPRQAAKGGPPLRGGPGASLGLAGGAVRPPCKRKKGWEASRSHPFFLFLWAQSKIRPSVERVTTCQGRNFPLFFSAVMAACSKPPQQGTSMRTTVTL